MATDHDTTEHYHVTRVDRGGAFGHSVETCNPSGCAGFELYLSELDDCEVEVGDTWELDPAQGPQRVGGAA